MCLLHCGMAVGLELCRSPATTAGKQVQTCWQFKGNPPVQAAAKGLEMSKAGDLPATAVSS